LNTVHFWLQAGSHKKFVKGLWSRLVLSVALDYRIGGTITGNVKRLAAVLVFYDFQPGNWRQL